MRERCPSARFVTLARLLDHRLDFTLASPPERRNGGVADVVPAEGMEVWGVGYEIPDQDDWVTLDRCEGYRPHRSEASEYLRQEMEVELHSPEGGDQGSISMARSGLKLRPMAIYVVRDKTEATIPPHREYKGLIIEGARHWGLPQGHIAYLETFPDNGRP